MKVLSTIKYLAAVVFAALVLTGCSSNIDVNLNNYVKVKYEGYQGTGTASVEFDYSSVVKDNIENMGEDQVKTSLAKLGMITIKADKTEKLSNNDTVNLTWSEIDKEAISSECGLNLSYENFTSTVTGLKELEKVDLFKDIEIKTDGKDKNGYAWFYSSGLPIEYWFLDFELDKTEKLSNGDQIKVTVKDTDGGDVDERLAEIGKIAESKEFIFTVSGLEELKDYDPFLGISIRYEGISGQGTIEIAKDYSANDYIYAWEYDVDKSEGLSNGDTVVISIRYEGSGFDSVEEYGAFRGLKMQSTSKEFVLDGFLEPLDDTTKIDQAVFTKMKEDDIQKIHDFFNEDIEQRVESEALKNVEYIGSIILYKKPTGWTKEYTALYNLYRCDMRSQYDDARWLYWFSLYDDIPKNENGEYNFADVKPVCPSDGYSLSTYSYGGFMVMGECFLTNDKTHFYLGYDSLEKFKEKRVRYADEVIFDNVDYTEPAQGAKTEVKETVDEESDSVETENPEEVTESGEDSTEETADKDSKKDKKKKKSKKTETEEESTETDSTETDNNDSDDKKAKRSKTDTDDVKDAEATTEVEETVTEDNNEDKENSENNESDNIDDIQTVKAYEIILNQTGKDYARMIKLLMDYTGRGLGESKDILSSLENGPVTIFVTEDKSVASGIKKAFKKYGAEIVVNTVSE
ncbi:MAG: hypothetical protein K6G24_02220 [Lachnospiraceae bacterium]|nr:hypothetical protein [Lachnospiraceae bacterium]